MSHSAPLAPARPVADAPESADTLPPGPTASSRLRCCSPAVIMLAMGWHRRWMNEDAFINLRIVDQIFAGHGPVFNAGERVEAYDEPPLARRARGRGRRSGS